MPWSQGRLLVWAQNGSRDHATCARIVTHLECASHARQDRTKSAPYPAHTPHTPLPLLSLSPPAYLSPPACLSNLKALSLPDTLVPHLTFPPWGPLTGPLRHHWQGPPASRSLLLNSRFPARLSHAHTIARTVTRTFCPPLMSGAGLGARILARDFSPAESRQTCTALLRRLGVQHPVRVWSCPKLNPGQPAPCVVAVCQ